MRSRINRAVLTASLILLASCSDPVPETSMDGIFTVQQAERGRPLFDDLCQRCHSLQEFSGRTFDAIWAGVPAAALYARIANTMPLDQPGSLSIAQVSNLMAHILSENGNPAGDTPLEGDLDYLMTITLARASE